MKQPGGRDERSLCSSLHISHSDLHYGCPCPPKWRRRLTEIVNGQPEHVIGAHPCIVNVLQDETLMETHNGVFICFKLSYNHTQDAAVWSWLMVLRRYTMRYFLKWETSEFLDNCSFSLVLLSFPRKA